MPLDQSFVGRSWPPTEPYVVGREKIRDFARAIGAENAEYLDPEAARALGYADVVAPPTFPVVITMPASRQIIQDEALGLDYTRVVHGDQKFVYTRPVVAGDELVCVNSVEDITSRGGHDFITTRTEVSTSAGEPVVTAWMKLVQRGEGTGMTDTLEPQTFRVTRADLIRYAGASGDFNTIHWSDRIATKVGLPGVIAHGMFTMALVGRAVTAWAGAPDAVVEFSVRFSRPVPVPDTDEGTEVVVSGVVKEITEDGRTRLTLTATCNGDKVLSMAQAVIRKR